MASSRAGDCPDCGQVYDGKLCICQAPWLRKMTPLEALRGAMAEDHAMKSVQRTPIEKLRADYDLSPQDPLPGQTPRPLFTARAAE